MKTLGTRTPAGYRLSFIINTVVGGIMLVLSMASYIIEMLFPQIRGTLVWGFVFPAVICLFIASLHYSKWLSLTR